MAIRIDESALVAGQFDIKAIKQVANEVVSLRERHAAKLSEYLGTIRTWGQPLVSTLDSLSSELRKFHTSEDSSDKESAEQAVELCNRLSGDIASYEKQLETLSKRFQEKKIRITSIGAARAGKSTFTSLYTGLNEDLVKTQSGSIDCTGAICNYYNDSSMGPKQFRAEVCFLTEQEVLESINSLIKHITGNMQRREGLTWRFNILPKQFDSAESVRQFVRNNPGCREMIKSQRKGIDSVEYFLHYFDEKAQTYWDYVGSPKRTVSNVQGNPDYEYSENIDEYNLLSAREHKCLAVREINVYANLGNEGLFENFIVGDTMGLSADVNNTAKESIKSVIDDSDAIFSIHLASQSKNYTFYEDFLPQLDCFKGLSKKHFLIVNSHTDLDQNSIDDQVSKLQGTATADVVYVGYLKQKDGQANNPEVFAKSVIKDMLGKIAHNVREFDQERVNKCNESIEKINKDLEELKDILEGLEIVGKYDVSDFIKKSYINSCQNLTEYCRDLLDCLDEGDDEEEYNNYRISDECQIPSAYWLITSVDPRKDSKLKKDPDALADRMDDVESATKKLFGDITAKYNDIKPNDMHFCEWLQNVLYDFIQSISRRKVKFLKQVEILITPKKDKLFDVIWETFNIPQELRDDSHLFVQELKERYDQNYRGDFESKEDNIYIYRILEDFFKNQTVDDDKLKNKKPFIDEDTSLEEILVKHVEDLELPKQVRSMYTSRYKALKDFYGKMWEFFKNELQIDSCVSFFKSHPELMLEGNDAVAQKVARSDSDEKIQKNCVELNQMKTQFGSISTLTL